MRYIKCYELWTPYNDYLINGDTEKYDKVYGFFHFYNMDLTLLELWLHAKNTYNVYPTKITKNDMSYISEDGCVITITLLNGSIDKIKKVKLEHGANGIIHKSIFNGKYSIKRFDELIDYEVSKTV